MSDASMHTPAETSTSRTKVARPDLFYGERTKVEDWILQFDLFFKFEDDRVDDDDRGCLMASYMRGTAATWVKPYLVKYLDSDNHEDSIIRMFEDHSTFKEAVRNQFGVINEESRADRAIQQLKQVNSAADYASAFQGYALKTNWDDKALMVMYRQGLKDRVKEELMRTGVRIETLQDLIQESVRLDNALYELYQETRPIRANQKKHRQKGRFTKQTSYQTTIRGVTPSAGTNWHDPDAMQLDNINQGKGFKGGPPKPHNKKKITCYGCGKEGHMARDCRSKNKVVRQLNVLSSGYDAGTEEEWEVVSSITKLELRDAYTMVSMGPDSPASESEDDMATDDPPSKQQKIDEFKAKNRAPTPSPFAFPEIYPTPEEKQAIYQELRSEMGYDDNKENEPPTLERQNATVGWETNDCPEIQWPTLNLIERRNKRKAKDITKGKEPRYDFDYRNLKHGSLNWGYCFHDHCNIHYSDKMAASWLPRQDKKTPRCKWFWFECHDDHCIHHLWDKRNAIYFPGHDNPADTLDMQTVHHHIYEDQRESYDCNRTDWQTCLNTECDTHYYSKEYNGFILGSFLGPNEDLAIPPLRRSTQ